MGTRTVARNMLHRFTAPTRRYPITSVWVISMLVLATVWRFH